MPDEISVKEYIDIRVSQVDREIDDLSKNITQHFELNAKSYEASLSLKAKDIDNLASRVDKLEMSSSFSAGKLWMVMAIFAAIPTILAIIALWRG